MTLAFAGAQRPSDTTRASPTASPIVHIEIGPLERAKSMSASFEKMHVRTDEPRQNSATRAATVQRPDGPPLPSRVTLGTPAAGLLPSLPSNSRTACRHGAE